MTTGDIFSSCGTLNHNKMQPRCFGASNVIFIEMAFADAFSGSLPPLKQSSLECKRSNRDSVQKFKKGLGSLTLYTHTQAHTHVRVCLCVWISLHLSVHFDV